MCMMGIYEANGYMFRCVESEILIANVNYGYKPEQMRLINGGWERI
jgi:hypothetical protein